VVWKLLGPLLEILSGKDYITNEFHYLRGRRVVTYNHLKSSGKGLLPSYDQEELLDKSIWRAPT
jgi:hypothetical protein